MYEWSQRGGMEGLSNLKRVRIDRFLYYIAFLFFIDSLAFLLLWRAGEKWAKAKYIRLFGAVFILAQAFCCLLRFGVSVNTYLWNTIKNARKWSSGPTASLRPFSLCFLYEITTFQHVWLVEAECGSPYSRAILAFHMHHHKLQRNHCWTLKKSTAQTQTLQRHWCRRTPIIFCQVRP